MQALSTIFIYSVGLNSGCFSSNTHNRLALSTLNIILIKILPVWYIIFVVSYLSYGRISARIWEPPDTVSAEPPRVQIAKNIDAD